MLRPTLQQMKLCEIVDQSFKDSTGDAQQARNVDHMKQLYYSTNARLVVQLERLATHAKDAGMSPDDYIPLAVQVVALRKYGMTINTIARRDVRDLVMGQRVKKLYGTVETDIRVTRRYIGTPDTVLESLCTLMLALQGENVTGDDVVCHLVAGRVSVDPVLLFDCLPVRKHWARLPYAFHAVPYGKALGMHKKFPWGEFQEQHKKEYYWWMNIKVKAQTIVKRRERAGGRGKAGQ